MLVLHLSHYVWRDGPLRQDFRLTNSGGPLRETRDLSYLSASTREKPCYLHESQTSICVTGSDISTWTALCMTDSYYDDQLGFTQIQRFQNEIDNDDGILAQDAPGRTTPCVGSNSIKDPRVYFLMISTFYIARIKDEWKDTHFQLREKVRLYVRQPTIALNKCGCIQIRDGANGAFGLKHVLTSCLMCR